MVNCFCQIICLHSVRRKKIKSHTSICKCWHGLKSENKTSVPYNTTAWISRITYPSCCNNTFFCTFYLICIYFSVWIWSSYPVTENICMIITISTTIRRRRQKHCSRLFHIAKLVDLVFSHNQTHTFPIFAESSSINIGFARFE